MQTILFPTDYSDAANNALTYAVNFAKKSGAKLILFHSYHLPVVVSEGQQVPVITYDELENENKKRIAVYKEELIKKYGVVNIETLVTPGFAVDEISEIAKAKKADLIVMGMKGSGKIEEVLIGSNTTGVVQKTNIPVFIVPEHAGYNEIKNIILACDYNKDVSDDKVVNKLKQFVSFFGAKLLVLNVVQPKADTSYEKAVEGVKMENNLKDISHTLHFPENKNIEEGIQQFIDSHNGDLLIMLPRKHNIIERIFNKSHTKKMAFHSHVPMLAIPV